MLYLKTEGQNDFCCAECAAGTSYLDISDLSLAGLKIPYTNRLTDDFVLAPGEKKIIGTCNPFRFIGMATAKPIKMGLRGKYESNKYLLAYSYSIPSSMTNVDGLDQELSATITLTPKISGFSSPLDSDQYLISTPDTVNKDVTLQILNGVIAGQYKFQVETATGVTLEFSVTVQTDLTFSVTNVDVLGLYSGTGYGLDSGVIIMDSLKKYFTFNNVFMADATFMGTVDTIELYNDTLASVRVLLISAS